MIDKMEDDLNRFLKEQPLKIRLRVKWIKIKAKTRVKLGICNHSGSYGLAGGDKGTCVYCWKEIDWED